MTLVSKLNGALYKFGHPLLIVYYACVLEDNMDVENAGFAWCAKRITAIIVNFIEINMQNAI